MIPTSTAYCSPRGPRGWYYSSWLSTPSSWHHALPPHYWSSAATVPGIASAGMTNATSNIAENVSQSIPHNINNNNVPHRPIPQVGEGFSFSAGTIPPSGGGGGSGMGGPPHPPHLPAANGQAYHPHLPHPNPNPHASGPTPHVYYEQMYKYGKRSRGGRFWGLLILGGLGIWAYSGAKHHRKELEKENQQLRTILSNQNQNQNQNQAHNIPNLASTEDTTPKRCERRWGWGGSRSGNGKEWEAEVGIEQQGRKLV